MGDAEESLQCNAINISKEIDWLKKVAYARLNGWSVSAETLETLPELESSHSSYGRFAGERALKYYERLLLILALSPHIYPTLFDSFTIQNAINGTPLPLQSRPEYHVFPGKKINHWQPTFPTGNSFLFLAAGKDVATILEMQRYLNSENIFSREQIIAIEPYHKGEPAFSGRLVLADQWIDYFTMGHKSHDKSMKFLAVQ